MQLIGLYRDPTGQKVFDNSNDNNVDVDSQFTPKKVDITTTESSETILSLRRRINELEAELKDSKVGGIVIVCDSSLIIVIVTWPREKFPICHYALV